MTTSPEELEATMQQHFDKATAIRAAAEAAGRDHFTPEECQTIEQAFAQIKAAELELDRLGQPQPRKVTPNAIGGTVPGERQGSFNGMRRGNREYVVDARGNQIPVLGKADRFADVLPRAQTTPDDFGAYIYGICSGDFGRLSDGMQKVFGQMGGQSDAAGGYLLPSPLSAEVIDLARAKSVFMQAGARTVAMSSRTLDFAAVLDSVDANWRAEHAPIIESDVTLGRVTLEAKNLGAMVRVSEELVEDTPNASRLIRDQLATEMAQELDRALLFGSGGLAPLGVVNWPNVQTASVSTPTSYGPLMEMLGKLWAVNQSPTAIVSSPASRLKFSMLGTGLSGDKTQLVMPVELREIPWYVSNKATIVGSPQASYLIMGNFERAFVGMRQQLRIEVSNAGGFYQSDSPTVGGDSFSRVQLRVRATLRADLAVVEPFAFVVANNAAE